MLDINPNLRSRYPWIWITISLILIALISLLDVYTGNEIAIETLYLIPILITTWWCGRKLGLWMTAASLASWLGSSYPTIQNYSHPYYFYSEALSHAILWTLFPVLLAKLKDALINANEQFISILRQTDSAVHVFDINSEALLYYNKQCQNMFGADVQLTHARQIDEQLMPSPLEIMHREELSRNEANTITIECKCPATNHWYLVSVRPIKWIGGQMVRLNTMIDITLQKQAKEIIQQQREKLDFGARLLTLGGIASALAHEISQPLAAIVNYNRGGVRRLRSGNIDAAMLLNAMEKSAEQAERAGKIIHRARAMALRRDPEMESLDINEIIANLSSMIELSTQKHNVKFVIALAPSLPPVRADRVMLEQLALNLTRNAVQAMQDIPPELRVLKILTAHDPLTETVELQVIDSGCGMSDEIEKNLFQPFLTTKAEGLGLGLALCRSIAEWHKGRLWATRNPDHGTTFHFSLRAENP